ncbi:hypothetical protein NQ176_g7699 [Zarea fungicola]|uniref:Uncharacterized protein n=1 Tax=Zarea fungicola TaxID=93591 RepID=A0ACC1MXD2_9HYPO|nr:hypothetical protein NQ176_g7699 [Lecanicillium fungicola]
MMECWGEDGIPWAKKAVWRTKADTAIGGERTKKRAPIKPESSAARSIKRGPLQGNSSAQVIKNAIEMPRGVLSSLGFILFDDAVVEAGRGETQMGARVGVSRIWCQGKAVTSQRPHVWWWYMANARTTTKHASISSLECTKGGGPTSQLYKYLRSK